MNSFSWRHCLHTGRAWPWAGLSMQPWHGPPLEPWHSRQVPTSLRPLPLQLGHFGFVHPFPVPSQPRHIGMNRPVPEQAPHGIKCLSLQQPQPRARGWFSSHWGQRTAFIALSRSPSGAMALHESLTPHRQPSNTSIACLGIFPFLMFSARALQAEPKPHTSPTKGTSVSTPRNNEVTYLNS